MNGSTTKTGRELAAARAAFEAAARSVAASDQGLSKFAENVSLLIQAAVLWAKAEAAHQDAMREYDERAAARHAGRRAS